MSQTTKGVPHKILIRNKSPGTLSTGQNTEVLLDGKRLKGVCFIKIEVKPRGLAKVLLEMYADVGTELDVGEEPAKGI